MNEKSNIQDKKHSHEIVGPSKSLDFMKWLIVVVLIAIVVIANQYFSTQPLLYRVLGVVIASIIAIVIALSTIKGKAFYHFLIEAKKEIKRVIWPTKDETIKTTMIVIAVIFVVAFLLWLLDSFFAWLIVLLIR